MKEILIDSGLVSKTAVVLNNGELEDVFVEHPASSSGTVGSIYKGIVDNIVPGMQSAFINIGLDKNAFLFLDDIVNENKETDIRKLLKKGQEIIVQITKEAHGVKGARVTTAITLPCHSLVLMPCYDYVGVSKKIEDEQEKERLKNLVSSIKNKEHGYIIRTDAQGLEEDALKKEMNYLLERWNYIQNDAKTKNAPSILSGEDNLLTTILRDYFDDSVKKIILNNENDYEEAKNIASFMTPLLTDRILYNDGDIFALKGIESKLKKLLGRHIWLDNGAYLVIDYTEALTVIDVNTGKFTGDNDLQKTILKTNIMAAKEIAKQLRLRAIGGIIIIDFIDMESEDDRKEVLLTLENATQNDKIKTNVLGFVPLGLCQLTRKKTRLGLSSVMQMTCPYCDGDGRIYNVNSILNNLSNELKRIKDNNIAPNIILRLNPYVLTQLKKHSTKLKDILTDKHLFVREDAQMHIEDYNISMVNDIVDQEGLIKLI
ncbi:MAG: Rne/Rng family ribonuclease [Clostridiales bacterium]|nr:Rne/Rng family ribonuclease [Clostridiales bacterium]